MASEYVMELIAEADNVRVSFNAVALKKAVSEAIEKKVVPLTKDIGLRNALATQYGITVTPFVPYDSREKDPNNFERHLNEFYVADGRIEYHRFTDDGDIAGVLYEGPIRGQWRSRYPSHQPVNEWCTMVQPGTPYWQEFVDRATPIIKEWMKRNNG